MILPEKDVEVCFDIQTHEVAWGEDVITEVINAKENA